MVDPYPGEQNSCEAGAGTATGARPFQEGITMNPVPPYTSLDMMRAMQREFYEEKWGPLGPYDGERNCMLRHEIAPDPIGLSVVRLRPIERARDLVDRVVSSVRRPVEGTRPSSTAEFARVAESVRDPCA
jgi:hypothetical protein